MTKQNLIRLAVGTVVLICSLLFIFERGRNRENNSDITGEIVNSSARKTENIGAAMIMYRSLYGQYPRGENRDIAKELLALGGRKAIIQLGKDRISTTGELLDDWKTPYLLNSDEEKWELRSAGSDRVLWTGDDIVIK